MTSPFKICKYTVDCVLYWKIHNYFYFFLQEMAQNANLRKDWIPICVFKLVAGVFGINLNLKLVTYAGNSFFDLSNILC